MKKSTYIITGITLLVITLAGTGTVLADGANPGKLADAIATKFHLKAGDVQGVIDQQHQQNQTDRQAAIKTKLDQAVKDGKLTQAQEDALIQKMGQLKTDRQNLKQWLDDNKIDLRDILGPMSFRHHPFRQQPTS